MKRHYQASSSWAQSHLRVTTKCVTMGGGKDDLGNDCACFLAIFIRPVGFISLKNNFVHEGKQRSVQPNWFQVAQR